MENSISVVVADDEVATLNGLTAMLELLGGKFTLAGTAADGQTACELCLTHRPDLLLTDIRMPLMDGIELTKHLADLNSPTTAIIISAYDDRRYLQHAIRSPNVFDYILKPFHRAEFTDLLLSAASYILRKRETASKGSDVTDVVNAIFEKMQQNDGDAAAALFQVYFASLKETAALKACSEILMRLEWNMRFADDSKSIYQLFDSLKALEKCKDAREIEAYLLAYIRKSSRHSAEAVRVTALVAACLKLLNERYTDKYFGIPEASQALEVTPNYLSSRFSRDVGVSFTRYLTLFRLEKAKEYLNDATLKIYQISDMVGFVDCGYFDRVFKDNVGVTPSEYRNARAQ